MAGKRKRANAPDQTERRSSVRVQKVRQKALDEKARLVQERVKLLSDRKSEICVDDTELHEKEEENVDGSPKRRSPPKLTAMQKGKQKLSVSLNGKDVNLEPHLKVTKCLRLFNKQYLLCVQAKLSRPDLKGVTEMIKAKAILYPRKIIGDLPGIDVGHRFFSRAEMCAVGFHNHWLNGIDYMSMEYEKEYSNYKLPLAVSIVMSGQYEDDLDNADTVTYTGQGGHNLTGNKRQIKDQLLERGNLALKHCCEYNVPVRVTRGHNCKSSYTKRVYTYDGLYKVEKFWAQKGVSGFTVYKYRLKRLEGQPELTTDQVNFVAGRIPTSTSEIEGLVCEDISGGLEFKGIPATNRVDDSPVSPTSGFTYIKSLIIEPNVIIPKSSTGCNCRGSCTDSKKCACAKLNGGNFPYVDLNDGRLIESRDVVFECGPHCGCGPKCVNRTSQKRLRFNLEVFRSAKKGWAVRSWEYIPAGSPVCEYIGVVRRTADVDTISDNEYIFEIDCQQTMQGLGGRQRRLRDVAVPMNNGVSQSSEDENAPEFCIDAGSTGNFARFINHSCEPNLFVQCVLSSHQDIRLARVVLFAADNISPMQELTYDYGYALDSVHGPDGKVKQLACYCGALNCRKRLY
ncbi:Histone-lysine N-methyltransferase, H3 lysine-9 specific SUVH4 [Arabidopsis thaliana]|jgi:euchromatic histone-lysine N-methyltransferase|uniref:Histone-lysine N-methyltransferase, H3 lysine-9 specific SUVH4 n=6 Tax=Arabidopsis TaxID=3701 RepID=SUVH4_ARATH|nr:histone-lysine N-methyltransferase, H3 lysine-9 specific SUVH4-like protein [Arabidopsis thaliana]Q8GZB6.2 RecName: Full=Histone-lysine N-methyltransferase, H3 lysine-9 specific SUVH4; AltName: Full=Histone H3-K9 methyltransferase 4; Short=H3-K9-HMTase 4; AltName: Full=Protein KRYPTONITE; AltName: Full=Protein SET DOMAIN GROUP 33; AltName: Full=Suppressor of variegation 3-9 homolog protein 4; Short=Su(var)3-9 homolog protein 4 [Arabidopsis thaliana]KAG7602177.1 Post-SET domain [Arabidopsis tha|eukprot:NP_196900.1 histone-lysine N-methyltransferase, H3 lysine-9 specific SUVH4-like protein [Arabidopsis thaliana]